MDNEQIYASADAAGKAAVEALGEVSWYPCGFAWVNIKPANSSFAKFLVQAGAARKDSYLGGVSLWIHSYEQSMQKKEAYAYAFAKVLQENNIKAYASSRMD